METVLVRPIRTPRLDSLTGLRWWAAFAVFMYHMINAAPLPKVSVLAEFGNHGVAFFFVLSGFVLTWSSHAKPTTARNFYWRRFARIWPAHFVALLAALPVFYAWRITESTPSWVKPLEVLPLVLSLLLLQSWSSSPTILFSGNPAAWTLTVEMFFYAMHPALMRVRRLLTPRRTLGALILIVAIQTTVWALPLVPGGQAWFDLLPIPLRRVGEFLVGMCIAHLMTQGRLCRTHPALALLPLLLLVSVSTTAKWYDRAHPFTQTLGSLIIPLATVCFALLIWSVASHDLRAGRSFLAHPMMVRLGEWSYAFYLVHTTVMYALIDLFGHRPSSWDNLFVYPLYFGIALAAAAALHHFVERPCERALRRWGDAHLQGQRSPLNS